MELSHHAHCTVVRDNWAKWVLRFNVWLNSQSLYVHLYMFWRKNEKIKINVGQRKEPKNKRSSIVKWKEMKKAYSATLRKTAILKEQEL